MQIAKKELFVLDVGCGDTPKGDVNTDLYLTDFLGHRSDDVSRDQRSRLNVRAIPNFVLADAGHLPFRAEVFDLVTSRQVIEHVSKPVLMAKEMVRVSKDIVIVETVHRRGERLCPKKNRLELDKVHINKFDYTYFGVLASVLGVRLIHNEALDKVPILRYGGYTLPIINFFVPFTIRLVFAKHTKCWGALVNQQIDPKRRYLEGLGF